jgi:putative spermidine/putrescine transport system permease protein
MAATASPKAARSWAWLGILPFLAFALLFLILPTMQIVVGAFRNPAGELTLANVRNLFTPSILAAFSISIRVSFASAFLGCVIGFAVAWAVTLGNLPRWLRGPVMTFSGVASNFAGVPLAFAFLATLGRLGLVTVLLREWFGVNL